MHEPPPLVPRRSSRTRSTPDRLTYHRRGTPATAAHFSSLFSTVNPSYGTALANAARSTDPDTLTFDEAMSENATDWMNAAEIEVQALENHGAWIEVPIEDATSRILPGTWVFRRKRTPDGSIRKLKGRYCVRGDLQEDTSETYAPVGQFCTVRIFLILAMYLNWYTCTIDFSSAFI